MANNMTFSYYYYKLMLIARSLFKWENLPNNMDERWIEKYLFSQGKCIFYKDPVMGFMVADVVERAPEIIAKIKAFFAKDSEPDTDEE